METRIAVSGHRWLPAPDRMEAALEVIASRIQENYPGQFYRLLSCLAEGADRLMTRRLVRALPAELSVYLPLHETDYLEDFSTEDSRLEFRELKRLASRVIDAGQGLPRPHAYQAANRALVDNCNLLVVMWDGKPANGSGGTGEVVEMARQAGLPLLWIQAAEGDSLGAVTEERFDRQT